MCLELVPLSCSGRLGVDEVFAGSSFDTAAANER